MDKYNEALEKAKAYDEALGLMRDCVPDEDGLVHVRPSDIFPELTKNKDEKIRKEILEYFQQFENEELRGVNISDWIAWLEKLKVFAEHGDGLYHFGNNGFTYVGNPTWDMSFLEKQGEQKEYIFKPIPRLLDMIEPSDRAKAYCQKLIDTLAKEGYNTDAKIVEEVLKGWNGEEVPMAVMDEQKPINKVQPKFKVGDWIVTDKNHIWLIDEDCSTTGYSYRLISQNGKVEVGDYNIVDEHARLWTIQDAKDGDVLICNGNPFLFSKYEKDEYWLACCFYCGISGNGEFTDTNTKKYWCKSEFACPATKEQRDTLFAKMEESGYKWNADKKELKKIDNEEVNGEDYGIDGLWHAQRILEKTLGEVDGYQTDDGILDHKAAITAVKKLYEQKPTQETEPFEAEHGKYYYCIKDYFCGGRKQASKGDVIQALRGLPIMGLKDASEYFLPVNYIKCNYCGLYKAESIIDALEVKKVDLGQEIKNRIDSLSNLYCYMEDLFNGKEEEGVYPIPEKVTNELFEFAKHFYELGLKAQKGE